jgi:hypothetical protein
MIMVTVEIDENGVPVGTPWEVIRERMERNLSAAYGVDFRKVREMEDAGKLNPDALTDERLHSEFKYEPYPGFKPKPRSENKPDWKRLTEMSAEYELIMKAETALEHT